MSGLIIAFLIVAVAAGVVCLTGVAGAAIGGVKVVFAIFTGLFFISLIYRLAIK